MVVSRSKGNDMTYQVHEYYHPTPGSAGTSVRGVAEFRKKADAIAACVAHPVHAVVGAAYSSETIFDNGKPNGVGAKNHRAA